MSLVGQWRAIEGELPADWGEARLSLSVADEARRARAAGLLGSLAPGRSGDTLRFSAVRQRAGASATAVTRALSRLDDERIGGELSLVSSEAAPTVQAALRTTAAAAWRAELATLPSDWSDAWVEARLVSTDHVERAALLCAPLNPARTTDGFGFRFRTARRSGYGASAAMATRCFERLDEQRIPASVEILRALSETQHVHTQGPVLYVDGKVV
jgi:hypothetical protein